MKITIKVPEIPNMYNFDERSYQMIKGLFVNKIFKDYRDLLSDIYGLSKVEASNVLVIKSNPGRIVIGLNNPSSYTAPESDTVTSILSIEYGSAKLEFRSKPKIRTYCSEISSNIRVIWMSFLDDLLEG